MTRLPASLLWLVPIAPLLWRWVPSAELPMFALLCASLVAMNLLAFSLPRGDVFCMQGGVVVAAVGLSSPFTAALAVLSTSLVIGSHARQDEGLRPVVVTAMQALMTALVSAGYGVALASTDATTMARIAILGMSGIAFMLGDLILYGLAYSGKGAGIGLRAGESLIKVLGPGYAAQVSVGLALVLVYPRIEAVAFVVLVPLMAIMQHTTGMLLSVRAAYMRTIGSLARVAEMQAGGVPGHADRVAQLAAQVGRRMRLDSNQMERLSLAAVLHEIGRVRDEGADSWGRLASSGAEVLARISFLAGIAPVLAKTPMDVIAYPDLSEPDGVLARIVRVCSDFDDLMRDRASTGLAEDAIHVLAQSVDQYDSAIVRHLSVVLDQG